MEIQDQTKNGVFRMIHVKLKDSLLPMGKVWSLDFLGISASMVGAPVNPNRNSQAVACVVITVITLQSIELMQPRSQVFIPSLSLLFFPGSEK